MHYVVFIYYFCMLCVFFILFACKDDIDKAKRKLKLVEETSDLQTEAEEEPNFKRKRNNRYISTSDEDDGHITPPPIKKKILNKTAAAAYYRDTRQAQPNITRDSREAPSTPESLQDTVVSLLTHIKAQNDIIISILREKHTRFWI
ncbi:uncharacterized protein LOC133516304 isoform X2 [Cydia pomonella]|uniref:uncharacterized protein LOC133516304 isoform X2 n=1 Tax=Cydia pomonella TaxID=82600 RepID=UPI002ADE2E69|nr:uncharacterized protein LOC133516304 isoform X2 [Cydia pomonella]